MFNLESDVMLNINNLVDKTLKLLVKNTNKELKEEEYEKRIDLINKICNSVYE